MFGQGFNYGFLGKPLCFTDTTDIFKDNSGVALYTLDYDASSGKDITTNTLQILGDTSCFAAYPLDGSSADLSGNYNGTDTSVTYTSGYFDQSASFDGSSSFITLPGSMLNSRTAISASAWVYRRTGSSDAYEYVIAGGDNVSGGRYGIAVNDAGSGSTDNKFYLSDGAASYHTNTVCAYNTWYHVVLTWAGTEMKFYVNGSLDSTFTAASCNFQSSGNGHKIGEYFYNGTYEWEGEIDQVRLFNKAISASEVTILYNEIGRRDGTPTNVDFGVGGKSLYGARFNGSTSYVNTGFTWPGGTQFSISVWINTSNTKNTYICGDFNAAGANAQHRFSMRLYSQNFQASINDAAGGLGAPITFGTFAHYGEWAHLVVTVNGTSVKGYVNGSQLGSTGTSSQSLAAGVNPLTLGMYGSAGTGVTPFDGSIDQVRIFNKELSSAEVGKLYGGGAGEIACTYTSTTGTVNYPPGTTPVAYMPFDNSAKDLVSGDLGTLGSGTEFRFGRFGQAMVGNQNTWSADFPNISETANSPFSVSCWVNIADRNSTNYFFLWSSGFGASSAWGGLLSGQSGKYYTNFGNQVLVSSSSVVPPLNQWFHYVLTYDGTNVKVYSDTEKVIDGNINTSALGSNNLKVLYNGSSSEAKIDQMRIYSTALTSSQVTELYNEKPEVDTSNFKAVLYDGTGATDYISSVGFEPDLIWFKERNGTNSHQIYDSVRGYDYALFSNLTDAQYNYSTHPNGNLAPASVEANGFFTPTVNNNGINRNGGDYVAWNWKGGGLLNKSASFNGSSSKISFSSSPIPSSGAFTVSAWVKTSVSNHCFISFGDFWLKAEYLSGVFSLGDINTSFQGTTDISDGNWHHCVLTVDNSNNIALYVDGTSEDTGASAISRTNGGSFVIGVARNSSPVYWWNGSIDQVRVFNKAISASEVTALYNETASTINTLQVLGDTSCVAAYPLGVGAGDIGNTYSGTPTNVTFNNPGHLTRNNSGTIESTVSANTEAGFSIVKFTVPASGDFTAGHGLSSTPEMVITKSTDTFNWFIFHKDLSSGANGKYSLQFTTAAQNGSYKWWGDGMTSDVIGGTANTSFDPSTETIAYCFHSVAGYSKIGSYTSTGQVGKRIYVTNDDSSTGSGGFKPSFVMMKAITSFGSNQSFASWTIYDNKRAIESTDNVTNPLYANRSYQEGLRGQGSSGSGVLDLAFNDDGFTINHNGYEANASGIAYIYMAFK